MQHVHYFKEQNVKISDLISNTRYTIVKASSLDTKFGISILCLLNDSTNPQAENFSLPSEEVTVAIIVKSC